MFSKAFPQDPSSKSASPNSERDAFFEKLGDEDIFIIAEMQGDGIDPDGMTKEQLLAEVERGVKDLNERERFFAFVYTRDGTRRLPFFTSLEYAKIFIGEFSKERNRVFSFELLGIKASQLPNVMLGCDVLAMNDRSADQVEFSGEDLTAIKRVWG